jgi:hypothetical protein
MMITPLVSKIALAASGVLIIVLAFVVIHSWASASVVAITGTASEREAYWTAVIEREGGQRAYQEFKRDVDSLPPPQQHDNAHVFGGALFSAEGKQGLSVCDSNYSYGCFHEFLGRAIATLGLSSVYELNQGCVETLGPQALSCQHGIGHGIVSALGYDFDALKKALELCAGLPYSDPIGGCYSGVFMEYNMRTMLGTDARSRPVERGDLQYPCDVLATTYKMACAFWSPQWWIDLQRQSGPENIDIAAVGPLCDEFEESDIVRSCYEGLGTLVPIQADFDADTARTLCESASADPARQLYCKSYAANSLFVGVVGKTGDAQAVCAGLNGSSFDYCSAYAHNKANLASQLDI